MTTTSGDDHDYDENYGDHCCSGDYLIWRAGPPSPCLLHFDLADG